MKMNENEWKEKEKGTQAYRVATFTDAGDCVDVQYVLKDTDSTEEELEKQKIYCFKSQAGAPPRLDSGAGFKLLIKNRYENDRN